MAAEEKQGENCVGYVKRRFGLGRGFISPTPRNIKNDFEETTQDRAEVVEVQDAGDGFPQHVGLFNRKNKTVDHRPGPGKKVRKNVPIDEALEPYEHEGTVRRWLRRRENNS